MDFVYKYTIIIIAFILTISMLLYALFPSIQNISTLEDINFAVNNTYYTTAHHDIDISTVKLYYYQNTTFPITRFSATTTQIKIYTNTTNATADFPFIHVGHHYATYTYNPNMNVNGIDYSYIIGVILLVALISIILYFSKIFHEANKYFGSR